MTNSRRGGYSNSSKSNSEGRNRNEGRYSNQYQDDRDYLPHGSYSYWRLLSKRIGIKY